MFNRSYIENHKGHPHYITYPKLFSLQRKVQFSKNEEELIRAIRNLSDPTKLKIYLLLRKIEELPVMDLAKILKISQSAVSHALTDLRNIGLVESHRCGQLICYSLINSKKKDHSLKFLDKFK